MLLTVIYLLVSIIVVEMASVTETEEGLSFLLLGDWGLPGSNQSLIAEQMDIWAQQHRASFIVALGDNFYCKSQDCTYYCENSLLSLLVLIVPFENKNMNIRRWCEIRRRPAVVDLVLECIHRIKSTDTLVCHFGQPRLSR